MSARSHEPSRSHASRERAPVRSLSVARRRWNRSVTTTDCASLSIGGEQSVDREVVSHTGDLLRRLLEHVASDGLDADSGGLELRGGIGLLLYASINQFAWSQAIVILIAILGIVIISEALSAYVRSRIV